jgi:neutral ceramidase
MKVTGRRHVFAGVARRDITPPIGTPLTGFIARVSTSTGVADRLHTRAVVLKDHNGPVVIVQMDLLALAKWHVDEIRRGCRRLLGISSERVLVSVTHTHSAPGLVPLRGCQVAPAEYQWRVVHETIKAVQAANERLRHASISISRVPFRLGINRRQETPDGVVLGLAPEKPAPKHLDVVVIETSDGNRHYLFHHACHPYVVGAEETLISGDFPSFACAELEGNGQTVALFMNGCAGNIAPESAFIGIRKAQEEGARIAQSVRQAADVATEIHAVPLEGRSDYVHLPFREFPTLEEVQRMKKDQEQTIRPEERAKDEINRKISLAMQSWASALQRVISYETAIEPSFCEVQLLRVGDLALVAISGEPFFEIGAKIVGRSKFPYCWALGYCNAYCGYIPTATEFAGGGYEVNDAYRYLDTWQIAPDCDRLVLRAARTLLTY